MSLDQKLKELDKKKLGVPSGDTVVEAPPIDVYGTMKKEEPVPEQTVQDIKTVYSPVQETEVTTKVSAPSMDYDFDLARKQAAEAAPKASMTDMLMGLVPMATSLALGGKRGEGVAGSAKYYTDFAKDQKDRTRSLEDRLLDMQKARTITSMKTGKADNDLVEVDVDGKPVFTKKTKAEGLQAWKKPENGDGKDERFKQAQKQRKDLADRQVILQTRDKLVGNKQFNKARERYQATNDAINVLNQKNPIGDAGVQILFAKGIFGEVGNLTAQEQAKFIGSPELQRMFDRMVTKYKTGLLEDKDRDDLLRLAKHMRERSKLDSRLVAKGYTSGLKSLDIDPSAVIDPLLEESDVAPKFSQQVKPKKIEQDGVVYTLNESTGEYE